MTAYDTCPECGAALAGGQTICSSCGWDATTAVIRPPRGSHLRLLGGVVLRVLIFGAILALPAVGFLRLRSTGPGPDLPTTLRWMVLGDDGRAAELVTIHRAHEIGAAAARFAVEQLAPVSFEGEWADTLAPYATMNVRGWMPLLFYGATTDMVPGSVQVFFEVRPVDGWGRPYRIAGRELDRDEGWSDDAQVAADLEAGLQPSFFAGPLDELDPERDWQRLEIASAGADGDLDTGDDLRFVSYFPVGFTLRLTQRQAELDRELEHAYVTGRQYFRVEGSSWDLIDARLLAEFRLEFLP